MAAAQPTGTVVRDDVGLQLFLERRVPADAGQTWQWLATPARLKAWIGATVTITRSEPGIRVELEWAAAGTHRITVSIAGMGAATMVFLSQRLDDWRQAGAIGPQWEYALDRLVASVAGAALPDPGDYLPSQRPHYERLALDREPLGDETSATR